MRGFVSLLLFLSFLSFPAWSFQKTDIFVNRVSDGDSAIIDVDNRRDFKVYIIFNAGTGTVTINTSPERSNLPPTIFLPQVTTTVNTVANFSGEPTPSLKATVSGCTGCDISVYLVK